jgi:hypothetical protein
LADFRRRRKQLNLLHLFVFNIVLYFKVINLPDQHISAT